MIAKYGYSEVIIHNGKDYIRRVFFQGNPGEFRPFNYAADYEINRRRGFTRARKQRITFKAEYAPNNHIWFMLGGVYLNPEICVK